MKNTLKAFIFFIVLGAQVFADKENLLKDACGHVALSPEQVLGLYSWGEDRHVTIGAADSVEGLQKVAVNYLANISFEGDDEMGGSRELVAERESLGSGRYCGIQYCPK